MSQGVPYDYLALVNQSLGAPPAPPSPPDIDNSALAGDFSLTPPPAPGPPPGPVVPPPEPAAMQPEPQAMPGPPEHPFPLRQVRGAGAVPAREVDLRGPTLKAAQGEYLTSAEDAARGVVERSSDMASMEYGMALQQERDAQARAAAAERAAAERQAELAARVTDMDQSAKALSKMSMDPDRFWASRSTGQKIAAFISVTLGGAMAARTGHNPGMEMINRGIDNDLRAQEFAYRASRDALSAKQTAFGMAMQKYNNVDAARAVARAAALDGVAAQTSQMRALWKGTEAANQADMMLAQIQEQRMGLISHGVKFLPAQQAGPVWMDENGIPYNAAQAREVSKEYRGQGFKREEQATGVAGKLMEEAFKAQATSGNKINEETRFIAEKLQSAGVPQARAAAEQALQALNKSEGGKAEAAARWALGGGTVANTVMGNDANAREQAYWAFANASMKAMMGNVTESEMARAQKQLGSAADPESRRRAIASTLETLEQIEKSAKAGASPEAQRRFDEQRKAAEGAPPAAPKGSKAGW